ncbi:MAG: energy transducer TonB, partial [Betaproteobacteria bacterium]|nr:energy transducer TonB [Betaproteobacteria bacterium]
PPPQPAPAPVPVTAPSPPQVVRTAPVIDAAHSCPQPQYPSIARRLEEAGTVMLRFLIGTDGHVLSGSVAHGSGFKMLDTAALRALAQCRFKPGTVEGKPVQSWANIRYVWKLED